MKHLNEASENFLTLARFSYLNPDIKWFRESSEDDSVLSVLRNIEANQQFLDSHVFHFMGIIECFNQSINDRHYFTVFLRRNVMEQNSWIEVMMYDTTLSKRIETIDESIRIKERILQKIAHEFKTPLLSIISLTEQLNRKLQEGALSKVQSKITQVNDLSNYTFFLINDIVQYLNNNTKNLSTMIRSINTQNYYRNEDKQNLEAGLKCNPITLKYDKVNVADILNFSHRILKTLLKTYKKIKYVTPSLVVDKMVNDLTINTDHLRLKQILLNLVSNAVKFTHSGYIKIIAKINQNSNSLEINVVDKGTGIREEDVNKLFSEFNMLEQHKSINTMGSGLGLAISQQIANLMGYKLEVESEYRKGSRFWITIPLPVSPKKLINIIKEEPIEKIVRACKSCPSLKHVLSPDSSDQSQRSVIQPVFLRSDKNKLKRLGMDLLNNNNNNNNHHPFYQSRRPIASTKKLSR